MKNPPGKIRRARENYFISRRGKNGGALLLIIHGCDLVSLVIVKQCLKLGLLGRRNRQRRGDYGFHARLLGGRTRLGRLFLSGQDGLLLRVGVYASRGRGRFRRFFDRGGGLRPAPDR